MRSVRMCQFVRMFDSVCRRVCACSCVYAPVGVYSYVYVRFYTFGCMCLSTYIRLHSVSMHRVSCCPDCDTDQPGFPVPSVKMRNVWQQETAQHLLHADLGNFNPGSGGRNIVEAKYDGHGTSVLQHEHTAFAWDEHTAI